MSTLSSSTSSLSSSTSSGQGQQEGIKTAVQPPRNLSRLGRTASDSNTTSTSTPTPTLGSSSEFKVPSLPRHHQPIHHQSSYTEIAKTHTERRPLTMIDDPNLPPASNSSIKALDESTPTSTPNRLKRLSLVAGRPAGLLDSPYISPRIQDDTPPTPRSITAPMHTHRTISNLSSTPRGARMRGSISYSPSSTSASPYRPNPLSPKLPEHAAGRSSWDMERNPSGSGSGGRASMEEHQHPKGETWSDRYVKSQATSLSLNHADEVDMRTSCSL